MKRYQITIQMADGRHLENRYIAKSLYFSDKSSDFGETFSRPY